MTTRAVRRPAMPGQGMGALIAGSFGLVFVWLNAAVLPEAIRWPLRIAGVVALIALASAANAAYRAEHAARKADPEVFAGVNWNPFGASYWRIVAVEIIAIIGGVWLINRLFDAPQAGVAWVSFVVGVHFFALAAAWSIPLFNRLAIPVTACGAAGLIMAITGAAAAAIALVSGVLVGFILIGAGVWGATRRVPMTTV